jgi:predicted PurR-regulated permease PerM
VAELSGIGSETMGAAASVSGMKLLYGVIDLVVIMFIGIYLAIQPDLYMNGVAALFPKDKRSRAREVLGQGGRRCFGGW